MYEGEEKHEDAQLEEKGHKAGSTMDEWPKGDLVRGSGDGGEEIGNEAGGAHGQHA